MIKLLKHRAVLLTVLFGLFANALSNLLVIEEMSWYYTALAMLIALVVNLLCSFLLKGQWSKSMRDKVKIISIVLFACLLTSVYLHTKYYIEHTFPYKDYEGKISYFIKGDEYTTVAKQFKKAHPYIESDELLIQEGFGSPEKKGLVWTESSIKGNLLKLISSYSLLVISFVSLISLLLEVLASRYSKSVDKSIEASALPAPKANA